MIPFPLRAPRSRGQHGQRQAATLPKTKHSAVAVGARWHGVALVVRLEYVAQVLSMRVAGRRRLTAYLGALS
jgi:hypothetical protein